MIFNIPQIAQVRVELNQLRESLDEAIQKQDFTEAADIKKKVTELELHKETPIAELEKMNTVQEVRQEKVSRKVKQVIVSILY